MRYNLIIYTQEKEQIEEIHKRLKGLTYASQTEQCFDIRVD